ncbi:MAG: class I SAM-dependent methyltransferase [Actinomycetota bacterium]
MGIKLYWRKLRVAPWIAWFKLRGRPTRDYEGQWQAYWSRANQGEAENDVLWDAEDDTELQAAMARFTPHADRSLPVLDLGCGNGRRSRFLRQHFDRVIGVDVSPAAIELATEQSEGIEGVTFQVLDGLDREATAALAAEHGPVNLYLRGVFHVIHDKDRPTFLANLRTLLGDGGALYQLETDGEALDYFLSHPEDSPSGLPKLMHRVIESGIVPHGFGPDDAEKWYGGADWEILESGPSEIHTQDLAGQAGRVPAHVVIARPVIAAGSAV